jgi:hypothetical protein
MSSLKGYTIALARILESSPAALYERQRALVRADLLDLGDRRGPGSGVRTSAPSVALLLIAVLAAEGLSDVAERTALAAKLPITERGPFGRARNLAEALTNILGTTGRASECERVTISRTGKWAEIVYLHRDDASRGYETLIATFGKREADKPISTSATIANPTLSTIADDVQQMVMEEFDQ